MGLRFTALGSLLPGRSGTTSEAITPIIASYISRDRLFVLAATLTLLPAVLGRLGSRVDKLALPWVHSGEHRSPRFAPWGEWLWRHPWAPGMGIVAVLLAIAAGLRKTSDEEVYQRMLVSRPVFPMGRDLGFLPGDVEEKLTPWMQPLYDNFDLIFNTQDSTGKPEHWRRGHEELMDLGLLQIEALTYIRGRTIPKQFFVIDEAQNLTPHEVKTIISRAGENTKVILTGDLKQIDTPYLDERSNGLAYAIERLRGQDLHAHVTLRTGERSELANLANSYL